MFKREATISSGGSSASASAIAIADANTGVRSIESGSAISDSGPSSSSADSDSASSWYSSIMAPPSSLWVLLGLGLAGALIYTRSRRRKIRKDVRAFIKHLQLLPPPQPTSPSSPHPLTGLTFAVQDIFDVEGFITGFGCPEWEKTHQPASCTAPAVATLVQAGATCVGKTHMDEMAYGIDGQNKHYGTPVNPAAVSRVPGGSASGSAAAVAAKLVDFALGI